MWGVPLAVQQTRVVYPSLALTPVIWIWSQLQSPLGKMWQAMPQSSSRLHNFMFCCVHLRINSSTRNDLFFTCSNIGVWIRGLTNLHDFARRHLPHITSASATARGGTAILGLCIARPSSTAHAAPGLRCGRFHHPHVDGVKTRSVLPLFFVFNRV